MMPTPGTSKSKALNMTHQRAYFRGGTNGNTRTYLNFDIDVDSFPVGNVSEGSVLINFGVGIFDKIGLMFMGKK